MKHTARPATSESRPQHRASRATLKMSKLKKTRFATAIIERRKHHETSIEETMIEMYLAGVSTRRIKDLPEVLWGPPFRYPSPPTPATGRSRRREHGDRAHSHAPYPHVFIDGIHLRRPWGGSFENVVVIVAISVRDADVERSWGAADKFAESAECWKGLFSWPEGRNFSGVHMLADNETSAMMGRYQRYSRMWRARGAPHISTVRSSPRSSNPNAAWSPMVKAAHAQESLDASMGKAEVVASSLEDTKLKETVKCVRNGIAETLAYMGFPLEHQRRIRANNDIDRLNRKIRRRARAIARPLTERTRSCW